MSDLRQGEKSGPQVSGWFVVVAGPPGSGKTTLATALAPALGLPLISKDVIKETLMDSLGNPSSVQESRAVGRAAVRTLFAVARLTLGAVLESNFQAASLAELGSLPGRLVEVRCICPRDLALSRYRSRAGQRHPGHLDAKRSDDELWNDNLVRPLGIEPTVEVETTTPVNIAALANELRRLCSAPIA